MNKPIRVFIHGQRMRDIYPHATRWQVIKYKVAMFFRKVFIFMGSIVAIVVIFAAGSYLNPTTVTQAVETVKEVEAPKVIPAVLIRIAKCESPSGHFDTNGQVVVRGNKNGSVDVGKYQLNSIWFKKATELKLNVFDEADNETMAVWLYENRGTEDWNYSKPCWQK